MKIVMPGLAFASLAALAAGCHHIGGTAGDDAGIDADADADTDADTDTDTDTGTETLPPSQFGTEFWAAGLSNALVDREMFDFAVVVVNPGAEAANVEVTDGASFNESYGVPAGEALAIDDLPWKEAVAVPGSSSTNVWASRHVPAGAYRIVSDQPVAAYQFNPFQYEVSTVFAYTYDASVLLPVDAAGEEYLAVSRATGHLFMGEQLNSMPGLFALVGTGEGTATLEITMNGHTWASDTSSAVPYQSFSPGETTQVTLQPHDVLQFLSASDLSCASMTPCGDSHSCCDPGGDYDLTGTRIRVLSGPSPAVFGGTDCSFVPFDAWACDHLEQQLPSTSRWGTEYLCANAPILTPAEPAFWRVISAADDNEISFEPASVHAPIILDESEYFEFESLSGFRATASDRFAVFRFSVGGAYNGLDQGGDGDPSMALVPPVDRYLEEYVLWAPPGWPDTRLTLIHPAASLLLDGAGIEGTTYEIADGYSCTFVDIEPGMHFVQGDEPFAAFVTGSGMFGSYAYPAGLGL